MHALIVDAARVPSTYKTKGLLISNGTMEHCPDFSVTVPTHIMECVLSKASNICRKKGMDLYIFPNGRVLILR
jgi:hypothetical protein